MGAVPSSCCLNREREVASKKCRGSKGSASAPRLALRGAWSCSTGGTVTIEHDGDILAVSHASDKASAPPEVEAATQVLCDHGFPRAEVEHALLLAFGKPEETIARLELAGGSAVIAGMPDEYLLEDMLNSSCLGEKAVALTAVAYLREQQASQADRVPEVSAESMANTIYVALSRLDNWSEEDLGAAEAALGGPGGWKSMVADQVMRMRASSDLQEVTDLLEQRGYEARAKSELASYRQRLSSNTAIGR